MRAQFERQASKAGAKVHVAPDRASVARCVADVVAAAGAKTAALAHDLGPIRAEIAAALRQRGIEPLDVDGPAGHPMPPPGRPGDPAVVGAAAGVSRAALGIAETGSVVVAGNDLNDRLVTMLPEVHVALLPSSLLVPSLDEAAAFLRQAVRSGIRYLSLVTGPSRTADIERVLTIGVQGPKALHVVLTPEIEP